MSRQYMYKSWGSMNNDPYQKANQNDQSKEKFENTSSRVIELKDENHLKFALKSNRFVIVKAEADWCQPCKMLKKPYEDLAEKCHSCGLFTYFTDDVDNETSCHATKVNAVPTFFVYTDGDMQPKKTFQGDFKQLEVLIDKILERVTENASEVQSSSIIKADSQIDNGNDESYQGKQKNYAHEQKLMGQSNYLNPSVMQVPMKNRQQKDKGNNFENTLSKLNHNKDFKETINYNFIPSEKFVGSKEGYVFKRDTEGIGYYLDKMKK